MIVAKELEEFLREPTLDLGIKLLESAIGRDGVDAWLSSPHRFLESKTPRSLIDNGCGKVVANLIADMLTGSPV